MTKSDIIRKLSNLHPEIFLKDIQQVVDIIFEEISQALVDSRRVEVRGFGALSVRARNARSARNPRTGETVSLGTRHTPYFRAGKELKDRLNKSA